MSTVHEPVKRPPSVAVVLQVAALPRRWRGAGLVAKIGIGGIGDARDGSLLASRLSAPSSRPDDGVGLRRQQHWLALPNS